MSSTPPMMPLGAEATAPLLRPESTSTKDETTLTQSLRRLSITAASAIALPLSPQITVSPQRTLGRRDFSPSPSTRQPPSRSPLRRSPSSMSLDARSNTPTLQRKASMNSLHANSGVTPPRASPSRRSSLAQVTNGQGPPHMGKSPLSVLDDTPPPPAVTAASIAYAHFKSEIDLDVEDPESRPADTIVVLHDAVYGHRYSRPRTSRAALSTIVERPERIHASIIGLSVAYVRLGERHAAGKHPLHPKKDASDIPYIPFRIRKTTRKLALSSPAVTNVHGVKWMEELKLMCDGAEAKLAMSGKELSRPERIKSPDQQPPPKLHEGDLYLCAESLEAMEGALGAVCEGVDSVFNGAASGNGPHRAFVTIRPPGHHCSASYPSGFCWVNNVHVGISHAALNHGLTHAAIIDFDLHHGDGSQTIAWQHNARATSLPKNAAAWKKTSIGYFSLHDINSYPCEMGDEEKTKNASLCIENAHGQNIWNVHLQPWKSEKEFWELYELRYKVILEKTRVFLRGQTDRILASQSPLKPKAAIFLSAGFDASEWESSGMQRHKVNVPTEFYARLTKDVVKIAAEEGCSVEGRVISVLEGGYSDRALTSGVLSHISGLAGGDPTAVKQPISNSGLGYEMAQKAGALALEDEHSAANNGTPIPCYDTAWWSLSQLELLDKTVNPPVVVSETRKPKDTVVSTYSSPTQSYTAKVIASPKVQRTASNFSLTNGGSPRSVSASRAPSPPPPEVDWATAAHELSKLLIPSNRQTKSCMPEELSAEATRVRRDRQSAQTPPLTVDGITPGTTPITRMSLRERKAPKLLSAAEEEGEKEKPVSKTSRRKTVAGPTLLTADKTTIRSSTPKPGPGYSQPTKQSSRRLSLASNSGSITTDAPSAQRPDGTSKVDSQVTVVVSHRPSSSQSIRPDSSMSSRAPPVPPVVVKKTRVINSARGEATKSTRTNKKQPLPATTNFKFGGDGTSDAPPLPKGLPTSAQNHNTTAAPAAAPPASASDMDSLTSGMKKIKISLITKTQREAKEQTKSLSQKATLQSKKSPTIKPAPRSPSAYPPILPVAKASTPPSLIVSPEIAIDTPRLPDLPSSKAVTPQPSATPTNISTMQSECYVPLPDSSPPRVPTVPFATPNAQDNVFVAYQPEGPTPTAAPRQEQLKWLEPNTSTPEPTPIKFTGSQLPVFSATGVIPFGKKAEMKEENSVWDVPKMPGH